MTQLEIPGLESTAFGGAAFRSDLHRAALASIEDLRSRIDLGPLDVMKCQMVLDLARAIDREMNVGRTSIATTNMLRELRESLAELDELQPSAAPEDAAFNQLMDEIAEAFNG